MPRDKNPGLPREYDMTDWLGERWRNAPTGTIRAIARRDGLRRGLPALRADLDGNWRNRLVKAEDDARLRAPGQGDSGRHAAPDSRPASMACIHTSADCDDVLGTILCKTHKHISKCSVADNSDSRP